MQNHIGDGDDEADCIRDLDISNGLKVVWKRVSPKQVIAPGSLY